MARVVTISFVSATLIHIVGCLWFRVGGYFEGFPDNGWAPDAAFASQPLSSRYSLAFW